MMYVTVYIMSFYFNSNCRILAKELNYRFTEFLDLYAVAKWFIHKILGKLLVKWHVLLN